MKSEKKKNETNEQTKQNKNRLEIWVKVIVAPGRESGWMGEKSEENIVKDIVISFHNDRNLDLVKWSHCKGQKCWVYMVCLKLI